MQSIEQLTEEILSLPSALRALLAEKLVESLEFDTNPTIQTAWITRPLAEIIQQVSIQSCTGQQSDCSVTQTAALDCGIAQLRSGKSSTAD